MTDASPRAQRIFLLKSGAPQPEIRVIGEELHKRYGSDALFHVAAQLTDRVQNGEKEGASLRKRLRELEFAWNGIGSFQA